MGYGVSACATCDGFFFKDKEVVVVGGGDTAMEEALFLTKFATKVTVIHRRDELRASKIMQERAFEPEDRVPLEQRWSPRCSASREGGVTGVRLATRATGAESELPRVQGVFVAIGHRANTQLFRGQLADERRRLPARSSEPSTRTGVPASSPAATSWTRSTARPSPPPAPAARPRSTPSAGSRRSTDGSAHAPSASCAPPATGRDRSA
jgi:thioredoxin reductase (NADPH)